MSKLELSPPLLIMTMGLPGAGKTFFARQFAEQYELACVREDRIRYELFEQPKFNSDEQDIIGRIYDYSVDLIMQTKAPIVCDGNFSTKKSRQRLYDLAKENGYHTLIVWLQTEVGACRMRAMRRDRRNPDSKYSFNLSDDNFKHLITQQQRPGEKEPTVVISGKHAFKGQSLTVLRKITELYANTVKLEPLNRPPQIQHRNIQ